MENNTLNKYLDWILQVYIYKLIWVSYIDYKNNFLEFDSHKISLYHINKPINLELKENTNLK